MGKKKSKKIARITRIVLLFIIMMLYVSLVISLLCASYNLFNLKAFDISQTLLFNVISLPFVLLLSIYYGSNYKKAKKVYDIASGLFVGILIVLLLITTSALLYKVFKIKKIQEENERIYDLYSYYVDFNSLESGYSYRIDDKTGYLYHIDEEKNKVEEIRPTYFYKLNKDYEFKVYRVEKGYAVINGMDTYFTKSLNSDSKVYKIKYPLEKIKKKYRDEEYYKLDGDKFNIIDETYASEQSDKFLFLFKKYNDTFYTKEKIFDIRIQIENNFAGYTNAVYNGDYVLLKENDKQYKIKFTFDKELNVIYSKDEL